jgi:hypothetical protein
MRPQGGREHRTLPDEQLADPMQHQHRLLLD